MLNERENECLQQSNECASACLQCALACLERSDASSLARSIALDMECADICHLAAVSIAGGDRNVADVCRACADACQSCAIESANHLLEPCQKCAEACWRCAAAFRRMTSQEAGACVGQRTDLATSRR